MTSTTSVTLERPSGYKGAAVAFAGALLSALVLGMALWAGPVGAQTCPPGEDCELPNSPPTIAADKTSVVAVEGQMATNTGTYSDSVISGDVTITASVGEVTKTGTNRGTWSWSLANAPLGRQQVTITATDGEGESSTTEFTSTGTLPNGKIVFTSSRDGNEEVYVMNADGTNQTRLTNNPEFDFEPAFSPEGSKIAFRRDQSGGINSEIYAMNANGTGVTNLTNSAAPDHDPDFSPDGQKIAFVSSFEIYTMNADGSGVIRLTDNPALDQGPAFSPDGQKIAFTSNRDGPHEIYIMNSDGTGVTRLTNGHGFYFGPTFSPDGQKIAFSSGLGAGRDIYIMNADGTGVTRLTDNPTLDDDPTFSPDGQKIAFSSERDGNEEVYVMNADGTNQTRLTNDAAADRVPSWGGAGDTAPPETSVVSGPAALINSNSATFEFSSSESDSAFECKLDGGPFEPCTSPKSYSNLAEGQHTFEVRATDVSGNTDPTPASRTWTVDATAPDTTIDFGPSGVVNTPSVSLAFSSSEDSSAFECRLTRQGETPGAFAACSSPKGYANLTDGEYTFDVRATDAAGNADASPASHAWTVDLTAPEAPTITNPDDGSYNNTGDFTVSGTAEPGARVELFEGAAKKGEDTADASGDWSVELTGVPEGSHSYVARATDESGNVSASSDERTVIVDKTAPTVESGSLSPADGASRVSRLTNVTATFSEKMDPFTLTASTVTLLDTDTGTTVKHAAVTAMENSEDKTVVTLDPFPSNPATKLAKRTQYEVRITTGAKDLAGNALAADKVWSFTTGSK